MKRNIMSEWSFGQLIANERKKQKVSGEILTQGIGTKQGLHKIEIGQMQCDKLFGDIVLQRLGRSPDKLEYILSWNEYRLECIRTWFEECVYKGKRKWAETALLLYERKVPRLGAVQRMYLDRGHAMISYWIDKDPAQAECWLVKALDDTFLQWSEPVWDKCRVSTMELENMLALVRARQEQGKSEGALLERCGTYIQSYITDGEENAKIYSKYAWLAAKHASEEGNPGRALALCVEALDRLRRYNIEYFMQPLLNSILRYRRQCLLLAKKKKPEGIEAEAVAALEKTSGKCHYRGYLNAIDRLHKEFGEEWRPTDSILYNCTQKSYHLDFEILRAERYAQCMTQEVVSAGVYEHPKEIAKIENRRSAPQGRKFAVLMEKLGLEREKTSGFVVTDSFEALELRKQIQGHINRHQYEEVKPLFGELEQKLDFDCAENRRVIHVIQNWIDINENSRAYEELLQEDWEMLGETYFLSARRLRISPEIKIQRGKKQTYRAPMRNETELINQIAILLDKMGRKDEAIRVYEWVLKTFERSRVRKQWRYHSYGLLLENIAKVKCSAEGSKESLRYELSCGKAGSLPYSYLTMACAMNDDSSNRETCRQMLRDVIHLYELANNDVNKKIAEKYYRENFRK